MLLYFAIQGLYQNLNQMCYIKVFNGTCNESLCNRIFAITSRFCTDVETPTDQKTCTKMSVVKLDAAPTGSNRCPFCEHRLRLRGDDCETGCRYRPERMLECPHFKDFLERHKISYAQQLGEGDDGRKR